MTGAFQVEGADTLQRTLAGAADALGDLSGTTRQVGATVAAAAMGRVPVRSGALAGSLTTDPGPAGVRIASRLPYAGIIHWGWPARGIRPHPFLSDAATSSESAWLQDFERAVLDAVGEVRGA